MANTIEILVSANVEASVEQLYKDIGKIQEQLKVKAIEVPVDARITKINIDKSATNYVSKEIKKMFDTITVDVDGNVLGFGKATGIKKQAEAIQNAILNAQKKLSNVQTDYIPRMDEGQLNTLQQFTTRLEELRKNANTTSVDVREFVTDLDVFTHTLAKNTKELDNNAAAEKRRAAAVQSSSIDVQKKLSNIETDYGVNLTEDQRKKLQDFYAELIKLQSSPNTSANNMKELSANIDVFTHSLAKNTKEAEANKKAVDAAIASARKKLTSIEDKNKDTIDSNDRITINSHRGELDTLSKSANTTADDVQKVTDKIVALGQKLEQNKKRLAEESFQMEQLGKLSRTASEVIEDIRNNYEAFGTEDQKSMFAALEEDYNKLRGSDQELSVKVTGTTQAIQDLTDLRAEIKQTSATKKEYDKAMSVSEDIDKNYSAAMSSEQSRNYKSLQKELSSMNTGGSLNVARYQQITAELEKMRKVLKETVTAEKDAASESEKAANERLQAIKQLASAQQELLNTATTVSGMYGDYKLAGSYKTAGDSSYTQLKSFVDELMANATNMSDTTRGLFNGWDAGDSIDFSKLSAGLNAYVKDLTEAAKTGDVGKDAIQGWIDKVKELQTVLNTDKLKLRVDMNTNQDQASLESFQNSLASDIHKLDEFYSKYYKIRLDGSMAQQYQDLRESFTELKVGDDAGLKKLEGQMAQYIARAKEAGLTTETFSDKVQKAFQKFGGWSIVTGLMMKAVTSVRDMVSVVIELDSALTELKKVTDETSDAYDSFMERTRSTAKEIGATMSEVVSATASWSRLGFDIADAETLAKASLIYSNVGDELDGVDEASEHLISTMQAFKIEASDVMSIVDQLNAVGNTEAISSGGVGEALSRSGAALEAAGNSLQESMAMIAAMNTTLQDPDSVGTVMKTLSMYLRAAKTEAEDSGESVDGMANSVSELRDEILSLTGNKVDIQIDDETFKSSYQIMKELSGVWDELSDISQANLLESIAGKRNANAVTALIENFEIAERVMGTLETSSGSALKENQKYLDSIEGRMQKFQATFESLATTVADSDIIKIAVSGATGLLSLVDELTQKIGGLPSVITTAMTAMSIGGIGFFDFKVDTDGTIFDDGLWSSLTRNSKEYKTIIEQVNKYNGLSSDLDKLKYTGGDIELYEMAYDEIITQMEDCMDVMEKYDHGMAETMRKYAQTGQSGEKYVQSLKNVSAQIIKATAKTIAMNLALSLATSAIASLVWYLGNQLYDALVVTSEEMENCSAGATALAESLSENDKWISSIEELRDKLSDENLSLSEQQSLKESLLSIQDAIIEKYGDEAGAIDLVNGKYAEMIEYLDEVNEKEFNTWRANNRDAINKSIDVYSGRKYARQGNVLAQSEYEKFVSEASSSDSDYLLKYVSLFKDIDSLLTTKGYTNIEEAEQAFSELYNIISKYNKENQYDHLLDVISGFSSQASNDIATYGDTYKQYMQGVISTNKALSSSYDSVEAASDTFNQSLVDGSPEEVASAYSTLQSSIGSFLDSVDANIGENADTVRGYYEGVLGDIESAAKSKTIEVELKADDTSLRWDVTNAVESLNNAGYSSAVEIKSALTTGSISESSDAFLLLTELAEGLDTTLVGVIDKLESFGYFGGETAVVTDEIQNAIDSYMKVASILSEVRDEQEKFGSVSIETYSKIISLGEDYEDVLEMQNGEYVFSAEGAQTLLDKQYELAYATLASENATEDQVASLKAYYVVLSSFRSQISTCVDSIQELNGIQEQLAEGTQFTKEEVDELLEKYPDLSFVIDESTGYWDLQAESLDNLQDHFKSLIETIIEFEKHITALQQQSILEDAGYASGVALQSSLSRWVNESGATSVEEYADYYGLNVEDIPDHTKKVLELEFQLTGEVDAYEKMISGEMPTEGFGVTSVGSSKASSKDTWKEAFEKQYQELQHQKAMERITEEQYLNGVEVLYKKYFSNLSKYRDEYYQYEEEVYSGRQGLIDDYIQDLEQEYEYLGNEKKVIEELNALLVDRADILSKEQKETISTKTLEYQEKIYRRQIDAIEEKIDLIEDQEGTEENIIEYYKSMINLLYDIKNVYKDIYDENSEMMVSLNSEITDLMSKISKVKKELWEAQRDAQVDALEEEQDTIDDYQDAIEDILDATVDLIKRETEAEIEALEDAQDARDEWYDNEIDRIEEVADVRKEALEDELEGYREIIEAKKEALQDEADEEDYNTEVAKKAKEISDLQSKIDALSLDDSKSAAAERMELEEELSEKKEELAKYQRDYSLDKQLEALDDELDAFEEQQDKKIDLIEEQEKADKERLEKQKEAVSKSYDEQIELLRSHLDKEGVLWEQANDRLQSEGSSLFAQLRSYAKEYTTDVEGLEDAWNKVLAAVKSYNGGTLDLLGTSSNMSSVSTKNEETIKNLENTTYEDTQNTPEKIQEQSLISQYKSLMRSSSEAWQLANKKGDSSEMAYWAERNQKLAAELNKKLGREALTYNKWKGVWYLDGVQFYHKGGVAGGVGTLEQNELLAVLKKREMILTEPMQDTLAKYVEFAKGLSSSIVSLLSDEPLNGIVSKLRNSGTVAQTTANTISVGKLFDFHADNITKEALPETEDMLKRAADYTVRKLEDRLSRRGIKTKTSGV